MKYLNRITKIEGILGSISAPPYRKRQVLEAVYQQYARTYGEVTSLPLELRNMLVEQLGPKVLSLANIYEVKDKQADKILFETGDKNRIEAVLLTFKANEERAEDHQSLCISSQSGCNLGCAFCATGSNGV